MTLTGDLTPGMSIAEPAAGTGGMLRAAALVLRERGQDLVKPAELIRVQHHGGPLADRGAVLQVVALSSAASVIDALIGP